MATASPLQGHKEYSNIMFYVKRYISVLTYDELVQMIDLKFDCKIFSKETLLYHCRKNDITKGKIKSCPTKNIKGLRKIYDANLLKEATAVNIGAR